MLPGGPINSREGEIAYVMMAQCLNEFKREMLDPDLRDFAENTQTYDR